MRSNVIDAMDMGTCKETAQQPIIFTEGSHEAVEPTEDKETEAEAVDTTEAEEAVSPEQ